MFIVCHETCLKLASVVKTRDLGCQKRDKQKANLYRDDCCLSLGHHVLWPDLCLCFLQKEQITFFDLLSIDVVVVVVVVVVSIVLVVHVANVVALKAALIGVSK